MIHLNAPCIKSLNRIPKSTYVKEFKMVDYIHIRVKAQELLLLYALYTGYKRDNVTMRFDTIHSIYFLV